MAAEKEDWRLLNDVEHLKEMELNPTDGEEIAGCAPDLKIVYSASRRWKAVLINSGLCQEI